MSVFGNILHKIFSAAGAAMGGGAPTMTPIAASDAAPSPAPGQGVPDPLDVPAAATIATPAAAPAQPVDVEAVLTKLAATKGGGGNWQSSIVDLLKLLDLDSSLDARKQLANELNCHVGADGTAEENIALHKAVMQKVAENGGTVPASMT